MTLALFATLLPYNLSLITGYLHALSGPQSRALLYIAYTNPSIDPFLYVLLVPKIRQALGETFRRS